jgi:hypothetical protein
VPSTSTSTSWETTCPTCTYTSCRAIPGRRGSTGVPP